MLKLCLVTVKFITHFASSLYGQVKFSFVEKLYESPERASVSSQPKPYLAAVFITACYCLSMFFLAVIRVTFRWRKSLALTLCHAARQAATRGFCLPSHEIIINMPRDFFFRRTLRPLADSS